ncbi:MAG: AraC family transcriptional regulator [Prochloraceae cyanobacterium]|nr:AraC family transcriptional regulator [Prochloraceae cyanobacterium]
MINLNYNNKDTSLQVTPIPPLLSSYRAGWQNMCLQYHDQPPHDISSHIASQHKVVIFGTQNNPIRAERSLDGYRREEQIINGDIIIVPVSVTHSCRSNDRVKAIVLALNPVAIANIAPDEINPDLVELTPQFARSDPLLHQIGLTLKKELELGTFHGSLYINALFNALAIHLIHKYGLKKVNIEQYLDGLSKVRLDRVLEFIDENLENQIQLIDLASIAGINQYYFSRLFKKSMGVPPYKYVTEQRINQAKQLLKQTDLNVLDIAIACGFTHSSHLARHFKRLVGISPQVFRKNSSKIVL